MKTGKTLTELAQEIERQAESKQDFIVPSRKLALMPREKHVALTMSGQDIALPLTPHAHGQLAGYTGIPKDYYDRMPADLLASNVNHWLAEKPANEARMIRTLDGRGRAVLSSAYRRYDHDQMLEAMLPLVVGQGLGNLKVKSCEVTDQRLYVKVVSEDLIREVKVGDPVAFGFSFGNCEIGGGTSWLELFIEQLRCANGMRIDMGVRKVHLGRRIAAEEEARELFRDDTLRADDRAFQLKLRDSVRALLSPPSIEMAFAKFRSAAESVPVELPDKAVEVLGKRLALNESERGSVLKHLALGGDLSRWGVAAAVTRTAEDLTSYDRASELESLGWDVIDLPESEWRVVAQAA